MTTLAERANGLTWRLRAMRRLWSGGTRPEMNFLPPDPVLLPALGELDAPGPGGEVDGLLMVKGWVGFQSGPTAHVEAWLNGSSLGRARLGLPRPDLADRTDFPHAGVSGFELAADPSPIVGPDPSGAGEVHVVATGSGGESFDLGTIPIVFTAAEAAKGSRSAPAPAPTDPEMKLGNGGARTLVVTHQLNLGGAQLYLMDLLHGLLERGAIDPLVISGMDGPLREELEALGIPVHISSLSATRDLNSHLGRVEEMAAWARPYGFELALINTATSSAFNGADVADRLGIPAVWAIHESFEPRILWADLDTEVRARAETVLSGAAYAIFEADATRRIYEPLIDGPRSQTIPYGLDLEPIDRTRAGFDRAAARQRAEIPEAARLIVCIGTVEERKAQIPLALAFDLIAARHPDAHLAFVGLRKDEPHSEALTECVAASAYSDRISLIPVTPDVDSWYGMADLLVCASDVESLPRTVLEAMAWETPVLATSVFGLPETIDDGETGWLCEPRDISALAAALDRALSADADTYAKVATAARKLVEQRHSLPNYAAAMSNLFTEAIGGDPPDNQQKED